MGPSAAPAPGRTPSPSPETRLTPPAIIAPTCANAIKAVIPEKADQAANRKRKGSGGGRPVGHGVGLYKQRNTVERLINKLKA